MTAPIAGLRLLVIDDELFQLNLLRGQLAKLGVTQVQTCQRARDGLALLQADAGAADVVFCDLQMPDMDGIEFVRLLGQAGFPGGVVLISGEDARMVQTAAMLARAHGLRVLGALHKPVALDLLRQALAAAGPAAAAPAGGAARRPYPPDEIAAALGRQEFVNHYQPKVDLASGRLCGVETLVRWRHPRDGMVYPDQFIGVAEQHGLIDALTRAVMGSALQQARRWQAAGHLLPVAVNVSMDTLCDHRFPALVAEALEHAGVPPSRLTLEVTESRLMKDPLVALEIMSRLRLNRVSLSIDDFGTGHSSLNQLRDVPFDELKIDRGFVHGASASEQLRAILLPSLHMARQLGMKTVAEGVETLADWTLLRASGCDLAQGYFIARPMAAEALGDWHAKWQLRRCELLAA